MVTIEILGVLLLFSGVELANGLKGCEYLGGVIWDGVVVCTAVSLTRSSAVLGVCVGLCCFCF